MLSTFFHLYQGFFFFFFSQNQLKRERGKNGQKRETNERVRDEEKPEFGSKSVGEARGGKKKRENLQFFVIRVKKKVAGECRILKISWFLV